jgi:tungstate transport system substrate-binding protein
MMKSYTIRAMKHRSLTLAAIFVLIVHAAFAQERSIVVASTTSTEQSGLFGFLLPRFFAKAGIQVKVVAVGTGQALDIGRRGDADLVFVHDRPAEEKFMAEGFGVRRFDVMYNDFVVVGPSTDPAHIAGGNDVLEAFRQIAAAKAPLSRAATDRGRTRRSFATGRMPVSRSMRGGTDGIEKSVRAWGRHST